METLKLLLCFFSFVTKHHHEGTQAQQTMFYIFCFVWSVSDDEDHNRTPYVLLWSCKSQLSYSIWELATRYPEDIEIELFSYILLRKVCLFSYQTHMRIWLFRKLFFVFFYPIIVLKMSSKSFRRTSIAMIFWHPGESQWLSPEFARYF